jgi:Glycine zipper
MFRYSYAYSGLRISSAIKLRSNRQFMSDHPNRKKKDRSQSSEEIQVPSIPKQTAGAVTGAAIGSVAGPIGAVVGGVVGALAGSAAGRNRIQKTARRVTTASKGAHTRKKPRPASRKTGAHSRGKAVKTGSKQARAEQSQKRTTRGARPRHRRSGGRKKRH